MFCYKFQNKMKVGEISPTKKQCFYDVFMTVDVVVQGMRKLLGCSLFPI